jgi:hypothetical protein
VYRKWPGSRRWEKKVRQPPWKANEWYQIQKMKRLSKPEIPVLDVDLTVSAPFC